MILLEDSRQQYGKHDLKHKWFVENGIMINRCTLVCGDYQLPGNGSVAIDTKSGLLELINDVQFKAMSKGDIGAEIRQTYEKYNIMREDRVFMFELITEDDSNRYPETQITEYCLKNNFPDEAMKKFLDLYLKRHGFFHRGLVRAKQYGVKLYILVEEEKVESIDDVFRWVNPRLQIFVNSNEQIGWWNNGRPRYKKVQKYPNAMKGSTLAKSMITMQNKYGCEFVFARPNDSGRKIVELLTQ